ncbi:phage portal protein family protein [Nodularia spumigena]|jgi:SPP1 gp7 family putative phage head morphogenesis protein|uniref:phage portal protein family protein n=1 Tax=Nodularia spumigena TaxID=70799 RepID=UPI00232C2B38|nr:DUF935 family protein [Nodularia spumigena]MDB9498582.1 DUF935 family protein [Nodularia spumigena CS-336/02]
MNLFDFLPSNLRQNLQRQAITAASDVQLYNALTQKVGPTISVQIVPKTSSRNREDIKTWNDALRQAENLETPRRGRLLTVYESVLIDSHLTSLIQTRTLKVLGTRFRVVGKNGEDEEKTRLLQAPWFTEYLRHLMDAKFYGHSLVEFAPPVENEFTSVTLISRRHVRPEKGQFVINESDTDGIAYRGTAYMDWCIEMGDPFDLGLLRKASPHALWKKNALAAWSEFDEKFGIPFRTVTTGGRDKKRLQTLADVMTEMGSAGWAILQEGETIELLQAAGTDVYKCFDMLVERANTEMSKLVLGQTMTSDSGSSLSQAKVHMDVMEDIYLGDLAQVKYNLNWSLLPFMLKHGYKLNADDRIEFDLTKSLPAKDQAEIYSKLLTHYTISPAHIANTFGIPESEIKEREQSANFNTPGRQRTRAQAIRAAFPNYELGKCGVCGGYHLPYQISNLSLNDKINDMLIRSSYDDRPYFSQEYFNWLQSQFSNAIDTGLNDRLIQVEYGAPDYRMKHLMEANIFNFSGAKTVGTLAELNRMASGAENFNAFKKDARELLNQVNGNWMKTEYNFAVLAATNGANWQRQKATADDFPYLIYLTAGDNRVREAHAALDQSVYKKTDPVISNIYPPNGYGCRCIMADEEDKNAGTYYENGSKAIELLDKSNIDKQGRSEWDRMRAGGFAINRGETAQIFAQNQLYVQSYRQALNWSELGQKSFEKISATKSRLSENQANASDWYNVNAPQGYLTDYNKRPIFVSKDEIERIAATQSESANTLHILTDAINKPDEVYFRGTDTLQLRYLKFYNDSAVEVLAAASAENDLKLLTWRKVNAAEVDSLRNGLLVKTHE